MNRLSPEETREHSIFSMTGREGAGPLRWLGLVVLSVLAWAGGVAYIGQFRATQVSALLGAVAPLDVIYGASLAAAAAAALLAVIFRRWAFGWAAATVTAYLAGFWLLGLAFAYFDPGFGIPLEGMDDARRFAMSRLLFAGAVGLPMLLVWLMFRGRIGGNNLKFGFGDWRVRSRAFSLREKPVSWLAALFGGYLVFVLIFALLLQGSVAFGPIVSGALAALLPAVLLAAFVNAAVEEIIFRGFMQPAFIRFGGVGAGLWAQGALFGLIHWGVSVGVLAALPTSLLIGLGSIVWGKAAYETRGLGWTIAAHFMIDAAIMSVYFVPRAG